MGILDNLSFIENGELDSAIQNASRIAKEENIPLMSESLAELDVFIDKLQFAVSGLREYLNALKQEKDEKIAEIDRQKNVIKCEYGESMTTVKNKLLSLGTKLSAIKAAKKTIIIAGSNAKKNPAING